MVIFPRLKVECENWLHLDLMRVIAATVILVALWAGNLSEGFNKTVLLKLNTILRP